ncbi:MAG: cytochrome c-type biosis protein CcmH [Solirubrobacteraceae bacterium]|nr:cytochrome c-type biosis protein CcmH [Solirubrobacteraceae bacterium]
MISRRLSVIAALLLMAVAPAAAIGATPRASLSEIENEVMCVSCREPLALAQSPQAFAERDYVRMLVNQGQTKQQIERALVAQYGTAVLGRPPAHGFNLTVYILPPVLVVIGLVTLAVTLPRWRRRAREAAATPLAAGPRLGAADARRIDEDLARYD